MRNYIQCDTQTKTKTKICEEDKSPTPTSERMHRLEDAQLVGFFFQLLVQLHTYGSHGTLYYSDCPLSPTLLVDLFLLPVTPP